MIKIIDYYADWCNPCKRMKPILEEIQNEREDVSVEFVNVDTEIQRASDDNVISLPTLIFKKNGLECGRITGMAMKDKILHYIDNI